MNTHSQILTELAPGCEASRILSWVERGCERLMRTGDITLTSRYRSLPDPVKKTILEQRLEGRSFAQIAKNTGYAKSSIIRFFAQSQELRRSNYST